MKRDTGYKNEVRTIFHHRKLTLSDEGIDTLVRWSMMNGIPMKQLIRAIWIQHYRPDTNTGGFYYVIREKVMNRYTELKQQPVNDLAAMPRYRRGASDRPTFLGADIQYIADSLRQLMDDPVALAIYWLAVKKVIRSVSDAETNDTELGNQPELRHLVDGSEMHLIADVDASNVEVTLPYNYIQKCITARESTINRAWKKLQEMGLIVLTQSYVHFTSSQTKRAAKYRLPGLQLSPYLSWDCVYSLEDALTYLQTPDHLIINKGADIKGQRQVTIRMIRMLKHTLNMTYSQIADYFNQRHLLTPRSLTWNRKSVQNYWLRHGTQQNFSHQEESLSPAVPTPVPPSSTQPQLPSSEHPAPTPATAGFDYDGHAAFSIETGSVQPVNSTASGYSRPEAQTIIPFTHRWLSPQPTQLAGEAPPAGCIYYPDSRVYTEYCYI